MIKTGPEVPKIETFMGVEVARLREVFDLVKPMPNWKMPIDMLVVKDKAATEEITAAVVFYCGGAPEVADYDSDFWRVTGAGYYEWIGA